MTDEIDGKSRNEDAKDEFAKDDDDTFDPTRDDETKVMLESLEPADATPKPAKPEPQSTPAVVKMKADSPKTRKACGCDFLGAIGKVPGRVYGAYRGIKSANVRRAVALGVGVLVGVAAFFLWPGPARDAAADPGTEVCEFLARPAARLYIDGRLASKEVPPIHRVRLDVGQHTVRFVSPEKETHKASIVVIRGEPTQWFMNFVDNKLDARSLISKREEK